MPHILNITEQFGEALARAVRRAEASGCMEEALLLDRFARSAKAALTNHAQPSWRRDPPLTWRHVPSFLTKEPKG